MVLSTSSEPNIMFEKCFVQCNVSVTHVVICNVEMIFYDYLICAFLYNGCQLCKCAFFNIYSIATHSIYQLDGFEILLQETFICTTTIDSKIILVVLMWVGNVVITKSVLSSRSTTQTYMVGSDANFFVQLMDAYGNMVNNSFYVPFRSNGNVIMF